MSDPRDQQDVSFDAEKFAGHVEPVSDDVSALLADTDVDTDVDNDVDNDVATPIDDCWNRIGVRGDASCPRLAGYIHCRNCPVHDAAAARVLDREQSADASVFLQEMLHRETAQSLSDYAAREADATSWLVFRIGDEWLGLPTAIFQQVAQLRPIHSLPHRRHRAVLGVVNVRGTLLVCASLARLFGIASAVGQDGRRPEQEGKDGRDARDLARLLVIEPSADVDAGERADSGNPIVFPVDAVDGVHRFARADFQAVPATVASMSASHALAVMAWNGVTVGLLDAAKLFETLNRSLT